MRYPTALVGALLVVVLTGTALVSPLYVLYQQAWQLSPGEVSQFYVIYMLGALLSLLMLGRLADRIGYFRVLLIALGLCLAGTALSLLANGFAMFAVARFMVGVSASLVTTGAAVALMMLTPVEKRGNLALVSTLYTSVGFALGPIVGGIAGQWAPEPLVSTYVPILALLVACLVGLILFVPRVTQERRGLDWRTFVPRLSWTEPKHSRRFALALCLPFICFGVFGLYAAMAPLLVREFLGLEGPVVSGFFVGLFLTLVTVAQILARRARPRKIALTSLALIAVGNACMLINVSLGSLWLFAGGVLIGSIGHGLGILSSTAVLLDVSREENRGAMTSTYWAVGYSGGILPLLVLGWAADRWGLSSAVALYSATVIAACALVFFVSAVFGRRGKWRI